MKNYKQILVCLNFFLSMSFCFAQNLPDIYKIDGLVSIGEYRDTTLLKPVYSNKQHVVIKENDSLYYVSIQSNTFTIANLYIIEKQNIKIMHASAALGETNYLKKESEWVKDRDKWTWRHRDTNYWDELHSEPLQDQTLFFNEFKWFANTVSKGSYREWEFVISKSIVSDIKQLGVTFVVLQERASLVNEPRWFKGVTTNHDMNIKLHQGDLPKVLKL